MTVRLRLEIAYDGTGFSGWARQRDRRTVQQELEDALQRVQRLVDRPVVTAAGRTDAGVHARGQVAHVDLPDRPWPVPPERLAERLGRALPPDVRVRSAAVAPPGFDARFSAVARRYVYRICDDPTGVDPVLRHAVTWHRHRLDHHRMNEAAALLLGEHDFAAFCRRREGATTVRWLLELDCARSGEADAASSGKLTVTAEADAFCHNMVRALVGALLTVGEGRRSVTWPAEVLAARVRDPAVQVAAPHGLCLEQVRYPPDEELAARADLTRRRRVAAADRA